MLVVLTAEEVDGVEVVRALRDSKEKEGGLARMGEGDEDRDARACWLATTPHQCQNGFHWA